MRELDWITCEPGGSDWRLADQDAGPERAAGGVVRGEGNGGAA